MPGVQEIRHPLVEHHLARLRSRETSPEEFRALVRRLAVLLSYAAAGDLRTHEVDVETPVATSTGVELSERIGLVPILRAGLGMVDPILDLIPRAEVWHLGMYRDEATAEPVEYYRKLPAERPVDVAWVLDPMLATGGSIGVALEALRQWGVPRLKVISILASRDGVRAIEEGFPEVEGYVCAVDADLNAQKFIVPGLGDAGDRTFNTL